MSRPRQLAEVERIVARIGADQDLPETQRLAAQRDTAGIPRDWLDGEVA